jgi:MFS family permease
MSGGFVIRKDLLKGLLAPPALPPVSRRAFRLHMAYTVLSGVQHGIIANVPVMAVKALDATDPQLQLPQAMISLGLFVSAFTGVAMARRMKKPFVWIPGALGALSVLVMAWTESPLWFLALFGIVSTFDFAIRPAMSSVVRSLYPPDCCARAVGTLQQYFGIVVLISGLAFAALLSSTDADSVRLAIRWELILAGVFGLAAFVCFYRLPDHGDGDYAESHPETVAHPHGSALLNLAPLRDREFRHFLAIVFLFSVGDLFYVGIIAPFFARDLGFGYVESALFIQVIPAVTAFLTASRLTAWFDRSSLWLSYALVSVLWGLDPVLLSLAFGWPLVAVARIVAGPAGLGSAVLHNYTGVYAFTKPGPDTSYYMGIFFFFNGVARLIGPSATAIAVGFMSRRAILLIGGLCVVAAGFLFLLKDRRAGLRLAAEKQ